MGTIAKLHETYLIQQIMFLLEKQKHLYNVYEIIKMMISKMMISKMLISNLTGIIEVEGLLS